MLAIINGTMRVLGQGNKKVFYMGTVEEDGYVYFNDKTFYRFRTPAGLNPPPPNTPPSSQPPQPIPITEVQQWYVVRNCWVRSTMFTNLEAVGFDIDDVLDQIEQAKEDAIQAIEDARDDAIAQMDALHKTLDNGDVLLETVNTLNAVIGVVNAEHDAGIEEIVATIWTN